jgi:hypothetical protein
LRVILPILVILHQTTLEFSLTLATPFVFTAPTLLFLLKLYL